MIHQCIGTYCIRIERGGKCLAGDVYGLACADLEAARKLFQESLV
jgi:hypothetical protein